MKDKRKIKVCREGRDRTYHSRCYPSATGFEDQLKHQFRPLCENAKNTSLICILQDV